MLNQPATTQADTDGSGWTMARERRGLGRAVWLFMLLREWTSPSDIYVRSGRSILAAEMGAALGVGERQARRDLQRLRRAGYVELENTGRGFRIRLRNGPGGEIS